MFLCNVMFAWWPMIRYRLSNIAALGIYFSMVLTTELWNKVDMVYTGDELPVEENALVIMNHLTFPDPFYLFCLALRLHTLGDVKFFVKDEVKWYFPFGTAMYIASHIFVKRDWNVDSDRIEEAFHHLKDTASAPLWIMIFLEGRRFNKELHEDAVAFAQKQNLQIPVHTLMPRVKGFVSTLQGAGHLLNAVYDFTIAYEPRVPGILDWGGGGSCKRVHLNVKRYPIAFFEKMTESETANFCYDSWERKNKLLEEFYKSWSFPGPIIDRPFKFSDLFRTIQQSLFGKRTGSGVHINNDEKTITARSALSLDKKEK